MPSFTDKLMQWHLKNNHRKLPWKGEKDTYKIWLSEVILQQTRAEQAIPYYLKFIRHFPSIKSLANADEKEIFRLWQGLGYYNRCKNLIAAARQICFERKGVFPENYEDILALKGVGNYTAAAIASFAYNQPYAVVDGNVKRVLTRYFGITDSPDTATGHKKITELANQLISKSKPAQFNQAIMDMGATICKPKPDCEICPLNKTCFAFQHQRIDDFPVRMRKIIHKRRYFNYLILETKSSVYLRKRTEKDIWQNLYEPLLIESDRFLSKKKLLNLPQLKPLFVCGACLFADDKKLNSKQILTHQIIFSQFIRIAVKKNLKIILNCRRIKKKELNIYPMPKTVADYFANNF